MNILFVLSALIVGLTDIQCQNSEDPLILTTLIEENKVQEARNAARVEHPIFEKTESYSGYFTVNKEFNSNLFFWFFPSEENYKNAPVLLWLQGGPGCASLYSLFMEIGPFRIVSNEKLANRNYSWTKKLSVIFIDNPVGTGFSFTNQGYAMNQTQIGSELYIALLQFFTIFPELRKSHFYVSGESYAGKYIPAVCHQIHINNDLSEFKINLKGFAIGNGLSDTINQLDYSDYLYYIGLVDMNVRKEMKLVENQVKTSIMEEKYNQAFWLIDKLVDGDLFPYPTTFTNATGFTNLLNFLQSDDTFYTEYDIVKKFLGQIDIRKSLHVGNIPFAQNDEVVKKHLMEDYIKSVAPWVVELLNHYKGLMFTGQLDIIVAYPMVSNYLNRLNFSSAWEFKTAKRYQWKVDGKLAGYVKQAGNLTDLLVRNSGHMVPKDQPAWAYDMINRFTFNKQFH